MNKNSIKLLHILKSFSPPYNRSKCIIIEVSIPYAYVQWNANALENVYNFKMEKYNGLVTFLRNQGITVAYGAVIVSSIGVVFHETVKDINRIFIDRRKCKTIIKRLTINSIIGSLNVWNHYSCSHNNSVFAPNSIEDIPEDILESLDVINRSDQSQSSLAIETNIVQHPDLPTVPSYDNEAPGNALIACNKNVLNNKEFDFVSASDSDEPVKDDYLSDDDEQ